MPVHVPENASCFGLWAGILIAGDVLMRTWPALAAVAVGLTFLPAKAQEEKKVELGTLTCTAVEGERNRFAAEAVALSCVFRATQEGYSESYAGTLRRLGGEGPIDGPLVLMWRVAGDDVALSPGVLQQSYTRTTPTDAAQGLELKGQTNTAITLRPFAHAAETTERTVASLDLDLKQTGA